MQLNMPTPREKPEQLSRNRGLPTRRTQPEVLPDTRVVEGEGFPDGYEPASLASWKSISEAYERKLTKYQIWHEQYASNVATESGVQGLPWVVGTRGVLDATGIRQAMAYMEVPASKRKDRFRILATASVEALHD